MIKMADLVSGIFDFAYSEIYGIPVWLIVGVVILGYSYLKSRLPKKTEFKRMDLKKEIRKDIEEQLKYFSINPPTKQTLLRIGYIPIGIVSSVSFVKWDTILNKPKVKKLKTEKEILKDLKGQVIKKKEVAPEIVLKDYLLFKTFKNNLFGKISRVLNFKPLYTMVDDDFVKKEGEDFIIDSSAQFSNYLGIFIYSKSSKSVVSDIAYKISREQELEELVNFTPKMTFLEFERAKSSASVNELSDLSSKRKKEWVEDMTK